MALALNNLLEVDMPLNKETKTNVMGELFIWIRKIFIQTVYIFLAVRRRHKERGRRQRVYEWILLSPTLHISTPVLSARWPKINFFLWISKLPRFKICFFFFHFRKYIASSYHPPTRLHFQCFLPLQSHSMLPSRMGL